MHRCLRVDEILRLVFGYIEDRPTLCALARTCRAFNEPAMDLIWETLEAVEPILQHLPSAVTKEEDSYLSLSHPLSDNDWNTIRRLSSRVRRFHTYFKTVPSDDSLREDIPEWLGFLTSPPNPSFLFPNLRALSLEVSVFLNTRLIENMDTEYLVVIRFFHLLLRPSLTALRFDVPKAFYAHLDLPSIPALCTNIRVLRIGRQHLNWSGVQFPVELFSRAASEFRHLDFFSSHVTSWELLSSLARAQALRRLWLFLPRRLGRGPEHPSGDIFPNLRTLHILADSFVSCTDLFSWTSLNKVTEIYMRCSATSDDSDPLQALVTKSALISSQCKLLEFLWIYSIFPDLRTLPINAPAWPRPMLEPYQACHHLRVIALETLFSPMLTDNDLEDLVKAWPHLEVFHIFRDGMSDPQVHLTLRGVTALLYHCPKLKHFTLPFDATCVPGHDARLDYGTYAVRNTAVRYMGVHMSPVSQSSDVAAYLSTVMPYLEIIGVHRRNSCELEWDWIGTQHQQKPTVRTETPPMQLYSIITAGTEYTRHWCQ